MNFNSKAKMVSVYQSRKHIRLTLQWLEFTFYQMATQIILHYEKGNNNKKTVREGNVCKWHPWSIIKHVV